MSVRLFVLGILKERDAHGYDLIETARSWQLERWTDISFSSIYNALRGLEREGLIEEASRERDEGRPQRTVYRITKPGREALTSILREVAGEIGVAKDPLYLLLGFMGQLPARERASILKRRETALEEGVLGVRAKIAHLETGKGYGYWALSAARLSLKQLLGELEWLRGLDAGNAG